MSMVQEAKVNQTGESIAELASLLTSNLELLESRLLSKAKVRCEVKDGDVVLELGKYKGSWCLILNGTGIKELSIPDKIVVARYMTYLVSSHTDACILLMQSASQANRQLEELLRDDPN